jgi:hypothetical protein
MRRVSMATRDELIAGLAKRYSDVGRRTDGTESNPRRVVAVTGYHRKHAMHSASGPDELALSTAAGTARLRRGGSASHCELEYWR